MNSTPNNSITSGASVGLSASASFNRREALLHGGAGFGSVVLAYLMGQSSDSASANEISRFSHGLHHRARAKSVIFLFMEGGPSHIDLFDPKPALAKMAGKPLPASFKSVITAMGETNAPLLASKRKWKQHGSAGTWVSDWLPHIATCADEIAVVRSCWSNGLNHSGGVCQMNTGSTLGGRPSLGSWIQYGLGTENENLPAFVVMEDNRGKVINGPRNWGTGFMPGVYQGIPFQSDGPPIRNLNTPKSVGSSRQRLKLDLLNRINREHAAARGNNADLDARIKSYELAFRMQASAPEAVDLSRETDSTRRMYGIDEKQTATFGRNCLLARRLVERGVRFVQLYHGAGSRWDAHTGIEKNHSTNCLASDKPVAGLLKDLRQRGMLEDTLVVWGGEFGRTPMSEKGDGRDHNPTGFTMWMAGGGVRGGQTIGSTDEVGLHAIEDRTHVHDLHATILYLLGVDHKRLTYLHKGRPERPTLNSGQPLKKLL